MSELTFQEQLRGNESRDDALHRIKTTPYQSGSGGFVRLVDVMGDDSSVVQAARVSYGKGTNPCKACGGKGWLDHPDPEREVAEGAYIPDAPCEACGKTGIDQKDIRRLVRYLMRHHHTTPFEMAELKFLVRVPMDTWRQWIRQRTASVNEYSTRYTEAISEMATTPPGAWRLQASKNKQGSSGEFVIEFAASLSPDGKDIDDYWGDRPLLRDGMTPMDGNELSHQEKELHKLARDAYEDRLRAGVAREQARKDLPLSTYTEAYWKIDLHNLLNFLERRMDSHAQKEIRDYAKIIGENIVAPLFPHTWEAFRDFRLRSVKLSALESLAMARASVYVFGGVIKPNGWELACQRVGWPLEPEKCSERDECKEKIRRLGFVFSDE